MVYNDGTLASKPAPDYYVQAAINVGINPEEMWVFEDSPIGLQGAFNAKADKIIAVTTNDNRQALENIEFVDLVIDDYTDLRLHQLIK